MSNELSQEWRPVASALLGSWPHQVAAWGREGIAAFCGELEARGLTPDGALVAVRCRSDKFPPSAGELAAEARQDPDRPTFDEAVAQLYGPGGVFGFKRSGVTVSQWVERFAEDKREWLRELPIDDPDEGKWARMRLKEAWTAFCEATEGRQVHEIASRSARGALGRPDFAGSIGGRRAEIGAGS